LRDRAFTELSGVGDVHRGQWEEVENGIFHLRRCVSEDEQQSIGDMVDIRNTPEQERRWLKVRQYLPAQYQDWKE
jgi:hypothetical protein